MRPFYWYGNMAKTQVIGELLIAADGKDVVVFDYGCGDAGAWPAILRDHPNIRFVGFEPHRAADVAREQLRGLNARIYHGPEVHAMDVVADVIVSFSVFEHVVDRLGYLRNAARILAPADTFILNYDDGHFRNVVDLPRWREGVPEMRAWLRNVLQPLLLAAGVRAHYHRRVLRRDADALIAEAGFEVVRERYHNLRSRKLLAREITENKRQEFARLWTDDESELNERFLDLGAETMGDDANLWREMASRALTLRHAANRLQGLHS